MSRLLAVLLLAASLSAVETATLVLRSEATVQGAVATLGDLADITAEPAVRDRLAALPAQELPDLAPRVVESAEVRQLLRRNAPSVVVDVSGACRVSRATVVVSVEQIEAAARNAVLAARPGAEITVRRGASPITIPSGEAPELIADLLGGEGLGESPYRVRVVRHGRELGRALIVLDVAAIEEQVVAARAIAKGAVIDPGDLRIERLPRRPGAAPMADAETVAGMIARADIAEGAIVTRNAVRARPVVTGGQEVSLIYTHGAFALTAPATAMGDALLGEQINVRRSTDGKLVKAVATGPGVVEIVPPK